VVGEHEQRTALGQRDPGHARCNCPLP
jgi:hypothetical protein